MVDNTIYKDFNVSFVLRLQLFSLSDVPCIYLVSGCNFGLHMLTRHGFRGTGGYNIGANNVQNSFCALLDIYAFERV